MKNSASNNMKREQQFLHQNPHQDFPEDSQQQPSDDSSVPFPGYLLLLLLYLFFLAALLVSDKLLNYFIAIIAE